MGTIELFDGESIILKGAIIAIRAPEGEVWFATTLQELNFNDVRCTIRWLELTKTVAGSRKRKSLQKNQYILRLATEWDEHAIWRDCILADISSYCENAENSTWTVPEYVAHALNASCLDNSSEKDVNHLPTSTDQTANVDELCIRKMVSACKPALVVVSCMCVYISYRILILLFVCCLYSSRNVEFSSKQKTY